MLPPTWTARPIAHLNHSSQATAFTSCCVRYGQICHQVMKFPCQLHMQCWNKLPHAPSSRVLQAATIDHSPLCYLYCPNMTGLDWSEAVRSYKGKTPYTTGITWYFQVCAYRNNLHKKIKPWSLKETPYFRKIKYILDTSQNQLL